MGWLLIAVFTAVETVGLTVWLRLLGGAFPVWSTVSGYAVLAGAVLAGFLTVEHVLSYNVVHQRPLITLSDVPVGRIVVFSAIEAVIWSVWLALSGVQPLVAVVVLAGLLLVEHNITDNVFKMRAFFAGLLDLNTAVFSAIEAVGGVLWLLVAMSGQPHLAIAVLFVFSYIEHTLVVRLGRQTDR